MKYIIVLSNDSRTSIRIRESAKSLSDENEVEIFYKLDDFNDFLKTDTEKALDQEGIAALSISDKQKQSLFRQANIRIQGINLIILDREILGNDDPIKYLKDLKERLANSLFNKPELQTRYFLLSFEAGVEAIDKMADPVVDDLLMKPIDDQLFMQKLSMGLSEKRTIISQFLYNQSVESPVHMAKASPIETMSESGFSIRNTQGGSVGRVVRVFSKIFGERAESSLLAKVLNVENHPNFQGEFLVYYTFFGISPRQLSNVRKALILKFGKPPNRQPISQAEKSIFEKTRKNIAVIVSDPALRGELVQTLNAHFVNLAIHEYPNLLSFGKKNGSRVDFDSKSKEPIEAIDEKAIVAFTSDTYVFNVNYSNDIVSIQSKKVNLFDATDFQLISQQKKWMQFIDPGDLDETVEFLTYIKSHEKGSIYVRMRSPYSTLHLICLEAVKVKGSAPPRIKIQLTELKGEEGLQKWQTVRPKVDTKLPQLVFDGIFIDTSGLTEEIPEWSERLFQFLDATKICDKTKKLPVIALIPETASAKVEAFSKTALSDIVTTPMDRKYLVDKLSLHIDGLCNEFGLILPNYREYPAVVNIAQTVVMEMASEFGIQIRYPNSFKEGVFLRFYSPLFQDENFDGILARSYASMANDKVIGQFHNIFSFYGISDSFMKQIRKWIRETHIAKKEV